MAQVPKVRKAFCFDPTSKKSNWADIPIPDLPENFILVKVVSTTIHPLDFVFLSGAPFAGFGIGPGPHVLGTEGAGVVVAHGPGKGHAFLNKRVCMMPSRPGTWTDFAIVHINDCIIVGDAVPWENACTSMVLPLTALMFLAMAKRMNQKAVINTAANSCAGRLINRLLQANGIEVINLVRKADKAAQIAAEGARYILNTADQDFDKKLVELCMKLQAGLVLEAVGGEFLTKIAALSPPGSTICTYGSISGSPVSTISNGDLFQGKSLIGAAVFHFWSTLHSEEKVKQVDAINSQLGTTFRVPILKTFPFAKIEDALRAYEENKKSTTTADGKFVCMW